MSLRAKKLTAQQAGELWVEFYDAYGPEVMEAAYGWDSPTSRQRRPGETVWAFHDSALGLRAGWGVCKLDQRDPDDVTAVLVVGVWPEAQGRGFRLSILNRMAEWAKEKGAKYAEIIVFAENEKNHERHHRESEENGEWVWAGDHWFPDNYSVFVKDLTTQEAA